MVGSEATVTTHEVGATDVRCWAAEDVEGAPDGVVVVTVGVRSVVVVNVVLVTVLLLMALVGGCVLSIDLLIQFELVS